MSSGVFIDKEFLNRIELSRLDQDILKFHCFGCYPPWGVGGWVNGGVGGWGQPPHTHAHAHASTHARARTCMRIDMIISCKWLLPLGYPFGNSLSCHMRARVHVRVCVGVAHTHPHSHPPTHPLGGGTLPNQ